MTKSFYCQDILIKDYKPVIQFYAFIHMGRAINCHCPFKSFKHEMSIINASFDIHHGNLLLVDNKVIICCNMQVSNQEL